MMKKSDSRVLNITRGLHLKAAQALRAVENCAAVWVEEGRTIRDATLAEAIAMRNERARLSEPLPQAEVRTVHFRAPEQARVTAAEEMALAAAANQYASDAVRTLCRAPEMKYGTI